MDEQWIQKVIPLPAGQEQVIRVNISLEDDCTWAITSPKEVGHVTTYGAGDGNAGHSR